MTTAKKIRIKDLNGLLSLKNVYPELKVGDEYEVKHEAMGEQKYGFLIFTKKGKAIIIYRNECEVVEN